jgi:hypothetical protein
LLWQFASINNNRYFLVERWQMILP